jgi:hypothetical protein
MQVLAVEIKFLCPACNSKLRTEVQNTGRETGCTVCGHRLVVPSPFAGGYDTMPPPDTAADAVAAGRGEAESVLTADEVAFLTGGG